MNDTSGGLLIATFVQANDGEIGDSRGEGNHLGNLGIAYYSLGQVEQAWRYWQASLQIYEEIKSPNAATVRGRLWTSGGI